MNRSMLGLILLISVLLLGAKLHDEKRTSTSGDTWVRPTADKLNICVNNAGIARMRYALDE